MICVLVILLVASAGLTRASTLVISAEPVLYLRHRLLVLRYPCRHQDGLTLLSLSQTLIYLLNLLFQKLRASSIILEHFSIYRTLVGPVLDGKVAFHHTFVSGIDIDVIVTVVTETFAVILISTQIRLSSSRNHSLATQLTAIHQLLLRLHVPIASFGRSRQV